MAAILTQLPNILLGLDALDSIFARFQKVTAGMKAAVAEGRDLTADELEVFKQDALAEDARLTAAIAAARQREAATSSLPTSDASAAARSKIR